MKKVVFLGNPNVGKSALINALSDSHIKVGNWPGVTTEMLHAKTTYKGQEIELLDLPGVYHFGKHAEEKIATQYLLEGDYDLIVNVIDAMNLERNLYLTLIARELQKPMIGVLNFDDDVQKSGMLIDIKKLEKYLQIPIFKTSAVKKTGLNDVLDYIVSDFNKEVNYNIYYKKEIDERIVKIYNLLKNENVKEPSFGLHFLAYRLFEKSEDYYKYVSQEIINKVNNILDSFELEPNHTFFSQMQVSRYNQISTILKSIVDKHGASRFRITKKIDSIILHKWVGIPIFILFAIYFLSLIFNVANPFIDWIDGFVSNYIGYHVGVLISGTPDWFQGLVIDGLIGGIGSVLTFVPLMYFIYLLMAILEESGAMARVAFLMDRVMRTIGLNGKSFICMVIGFGCTVPAIGATRTIEGEKARKGTALMLPFISCGARLPVYALFGAAFFSESFALVVASLYILGILVAIGVGLVLKKMHYFDDDVEDNAFTIELPPYRIPTVKILFKNVNNRIKGFLKRVTTLIMIVIFAIWAFNYFPTGKAEESYLTKATEFVQPIFMPAGFGESREAVAAIPTSIAAKEAVVATIGSLQGIEEEETEGRPEESYIGYQLVALKDATIDGLKGFIPQGITSFFDASPDATEVEDENITKSQQLFTGDDAALKAYAYMVFILLLVPCAVAIATVKKEFGTRFMWKVLGLTLIIPYVMSIIVYQVGKILFF